MDQDNRASQRHRTLKGAHIVINDGFSTIECTVRNLSESGALVRVASVIGVPDQFQLVLSDGQKYACTVVRRTATDLGVTFS